MMRSATLLALSTALFFFFIASASSDEQHDPLTGVFADWMRTHSKSYSSEEFVFRWNVWRENHRFIEEHNRQNHSYRLAMNQFGDLTADEVLAPCSSYSLKKDNNATSEAVAPASACPCGGVSSYTLKEDNATSETVAPTVARRYPASLDWRTWGGVQVVKNQGSCGACYAFAAIGALETAYWRSHGFLPDLSEQQVIDCTIEYGNYGCSGGWMHTAFKWLQEKGGAVAQRDYPYTASVGTCRSASMGKVAQVARYSRINSEQALLDAVATTGTVSVGFNAGTPAFAYYRSGILDVPNCGNTPTFAALVVGYGSENGKDYWILKNSWGPDWGEKGYFRMARGKNMCGIADWASYPIAA